MDDAGPGDEGNVDAGSAQEARQLDLSRDRVRVAENAHLGSRLGKEREIERRSVWPEHVARIAQQRDLFREIELLGIYHVKPVPPRRFLDLGMIEQLAASPRLAGKVNPLMSGARRYRKVGTPRHLAYDRREAFRWRGKIVPLQP